MVPTIHDVAERAGVSISTVSRVLNNSAAVRHEKRSRVEAAAAELGYRPNPAALSLLGRKTGGIGVLLPYVAGDFFSMFLRGIDQFTSDRDQFLSVTSTHRSRDDMKAILDTLHRRVDGLIVMATEVPAATVCGWLPDTTPIVFVNADVSGLEAPAVNFDNRGGAFAATEHLVERGHTHIAFLSGPRGSYDGDERRTGYLSALAAHGLAPAPELPGDYSMEKGEAAAVAFLASDPRPTAVFAANDDSAFGLMTGVHAAGLRVPDDVAIAGFDDVQLAQIARPSLTTVHAPAFEVGQAAIERLAEQIDSGHRGSGITVLPTTLTVRASTGA